MVALVIFLAKPTALSSVLGLVLILPGEALRLWASGHIKKWEKLATGGPYGHCQHPLYLGSVMIAIGVAVFSADLVVFLAAVAYFSLFFPFIMREERQRLFEHFGEEYSLWAEKVPAFLPRLFPIGPRTTRFSWKRMLHNREPEACVGRLAALSLLYFQDLLF